MRLLVIIIILVKEIKKPVISAGAIHYLGASIAQVGSSFIFSHESIAI